jgi:hypothetical protein
MIKVKKKNKLIPPFKNKLNPTLSKKQIKLNTHTYIYFLTLI